MNVLPYGTWYPSFRFWADGPPGEFLTKKGATGAG